MKLNGTIIIEKDEYYTICDISQSSLVIAIAQQFCKIWNSFVCVSADEKIIARQVKLKGIENENYEKNYRKLHE